MAAPQKALIALFATLLLAAAKPGQSRFLDPETGTVPLSAKAAPSETGPVPFSDVRAQSHGKAHIFRLKPETGTVPVFVAGQKTGTVPVSPEAGKTVRIVSLVPAVTEMLYAFGAGSRVVAVSSFDTFPAQVKQLPTVGALLDPNVERILALKPDLVVVYGSQDDLKQQLTRARVRFFDYRHAGLPDIVSTIRSRGMQTGDGPAAEALATSIERGLDDIRARVKARPRPRTLLVFGRERLALRGIYASGGVGFLHDMLETAGGANVFAGVKLQAVQASTEQILAARPEVIVEVRATNSAFPSGERGAELNAWKTLASVPAVRTGRVHFLFDDRIVIPGPRVVEGTLAIARALHPELFHE
jgi:iron complex transport system substrate-binding protein